MAAVESNMLELGTIAPDFQLLDTVSNKTLSLNETKSDIATVIMFICNHCPFVKHINESLRNISNTYLDKGISFIAINSNDVENYPDDSPDKMKKLVEDFGYRFPYLYDESQNVAKSYKAACTPDFYVFNKNLECVYRGQYDDSRPGNNIPVTGKDLKNALDSILKGKNPSSNQKPSIGCNIKWKK